MAKIKFWSIWLCCLSVMLSVAAVTAAPQHPAPAQPPPEMPAQFDQATVQRLIDTIEQGQNAIVLKIGYFLRRTAHPFPAQDGLALLTGAVEKEPAGSHRWFVLQMVRGFAGFRVAAATREEGYKAYDALFSQADAAEKAGAVDVVHRAVLDYASMVYGDYGTKEFGVGPLKEILLKALSAHLRYLAQAESETYKVPWARAIAAVRGEDEFAALIEKTLSNAAVPKTYLLLRTAAGVLDATNPGRSVELLRQAKPLLPRGDLLQARSLYQFLVGHLSDFRKWDEAAIEQKELIKRTGQGRAELVVIQWWQKDQKGFSETIASLSTPEADEREINETAQALFKIKLDESDERASDDKKRLDKEAASLLQVYLESQRTRDVEMELNARLHLGQYLLRTGAQAAAKKVLTIEDLKQPLPNRAAKYYHSEIQKLLRAVSPQAWEPTL